MRHLIARAINALAARLAPADAPDHTRPVDLDAAARWRAENRSDLPRRGVR